MRLLYIIYFWEILIQHHFKYVHPLFYKQVANCGPADYNYDETISTLRYANRAKNIKNRAKINEDPKDALLRQFQKEIEDLKKQLEDGGTLSGDEDSGEDEEDDGDEGGGGGSGKKGKKKKKGRRKLWDKIAQDILPYQQASPYSFVWKDIKYTSMRVFQFSSEICICFIQICGQ